MPLRFDSCEQVEPSTIRAFGIEISSQTGDANEIRELIDFAHMCEKLKVARFVDRACYLSDSGTVAFHFVDHVVLSSHVQRQVESAARETLSSFEPTAGTAPCSPQQRARVHRPAPPLAGSIAGS